MISSLEQMELEFLRLEKELGYPIDASVRRTLLLRQITWETRHGIVDGVEIDLRHDLLVPGDWDPIRYFGSSDHVYEGPCLIFPWSREDWRYLPPRPSKPLTVRAGDRLRIARVVRHRFASSELNHPADREFRAAHFVIERASGRRTKVPRPLLFWPPLSLSRPRRWGRPNFDRVSARVCNALGVSDLDSFELIADSLTLAEAAFEAAGTVRDRWRRTWDELNRLKEEEREGVQLWLRDLVDESVALGYFAAQSEAERFVEPRARRELDRTAASGEGGRRSGATRQRQASEWRARATELILELMRQPGPHKREAIVFEVQEAWRWPDVRKPGDRSLWALVKELDDQGVITFNAR